MTQAQIDYKKLFLDALDEAFRGDSSKNIGDIENCCDEKNKEYFLGIAHNDPKAMKELENSVKRFKEAKDYE